MDTSGARDLSRAQLQRSVETAVVRQTCDPYMAARASSLEALDFESLALVGEIRALGFEDNSPTWGMAQATAEALFKPGDLQLPAKPTETGILDILAEEYAYHPTIKQVLDEGLAAQAHFPIRLAYDISQAARGQGVPGFETKTLGDIARLLRRPDFRQVVDEAAFTNNGVWEQYSTVPGQKYEAQNVYERPGTTRPSKIEVKFDGHGMVGWTPEWQAYLKNRLQGVNHQGDRPKGNDRNAMVQSDSSSSGCPARHRRAHFTGKADVVWLGILGTYFDKPPGELLRTHQLSVIEQGLDLTADGLEHVERRQAELIAGMVQKAAERLLSMLRKEL
ncbi:MAG TPA: hypothetical protein VLF71_03780 [Candidatus Saccharimonadales bacterium]|nr:hypothetical protein [Candidatus Saccharimonadales bacterium]